MKLNGKKLTLGEGDTAGTAPGHVAIGYQAAASDAKMTVIGACSAASPSATVSRQPSTAGSS